MEEYLNSPKGSLRRDNSKCHDTMSQFSEARKELRVYKYAARGTRNDVNKLRMFLSAGPGMYATAYVGIDICTNLVTRGVFAIGEIPMALRRSFSPL